MNSLYIVATPVGNLGDITIRAIRTILTTKVIACEDTRRTGQLVKILREKYDKALEIGALSEHTFMSVRDWNEAKSVENIIKFLQQGDVALVSDAGTPLISDPGYKVVSVVRAAGFRVIPIPGVSAMTTALCAAGLPTNKVMFWGFLHKHWILEPGITHVIYESPLRVAETINEIKVKHPNAEIVIAREMTKIYEEFSSDLGKTIDKGEVTLVVYVPREKSSSED